jgi:hypothetical protein
MKATESFSRRTEITIETHSVTIVRSGRGTAVYCEKCGTEVRPFQDDHAAIVFASRAETIDDLVRTGRVHSTRHGLCGLSLAKYFGRDIRFIED